MNGSYGLTASEAKREMKALREFGKKMRQTPGAARAFLMKHGFITKTGKLTKRYGG